MFASLMFNMKSPSPREPNKEEDVFYSLFKVASLSPSHVYVHEYTRYRCKCLILFIYRLSFIRF